MQEPPVFIFFAFPFLFAGFWLLIVTILSAVSGWKTIEARFPDRPDETGTTIHWASGVLRGVNMNNILTLTACRTGLRVAIWKLFGPFDRPFFVPWSQIEVARHGSGLFGRAVLVLGGEHRLYISSTLADRLAAAAGGSWPGGAEGRNAPIVS